MGVKFLVLLLLCAPFGRAQLATTDDGRQILLSTYWRLTGEAAEANHFGIYRAAENHWTRVAHTDQGPALGRPFLSGDGSVAGWERYTWCAGSCMIAVPRSATEFQGVAVPASVGTYNLMMSRNARYALAPGFLGAVPFILADLSTGRQYTAPAAPDFRAYGVANDGSVIGLAAVRNQYLSQVVTPNRVMVWRPGGEAREIFRADNVWNLWLSADGSHALVEELTPGRELWVVDIASGNRRFVAQLVPDGSYRFLEQVNHQLSNDGSRALYVWPSQNTSVWFWQAGAGSRAVARADEGFLTAVLSGDGRIAWALTASGRLLRITLDSEITDEVLPALPPRLDPGYAGTAPGSAMILRGGISQGLRFTVGDLAFPVIDDTSRDSIAVEIPWEATAGSTPMVVQREGDPFELAVPVYVEDAVRPLIAGAPDSQGLVQIKAAQQDFRALVTADNPAPAGSTIHTWFYNLGALDRPVATGAPGPSDPPAVPLAPLGCFLLTAPGTPGRPVEMPFLAYAPGLIGVYQADLVIPADWAASTGLLICDVRGASTYAWIPIAPARP